MGNKVCVTVIVLIGDQMKGKKGQATSGLLSIREYPIPLCSMYNNFLPKLARQIFTGEMLVHLTLKHFSK